MLRITSMNDTEGRPWRSGGYGPEPPLQARDPLLVAELRSHMLRGLANK